MDKQQESKSTADDGKSVMAQFVQEVRNYAFFALQLHSFVICCTFVSGER